MSDSSLRHRLAAILAADATGYSRLMSADEGSTVAALDAARAVFRAGIESNQGRVVDMAGDSVLAVFEIATGAVSAALAVQQRLNASSSKLPEDRRMRFRIGVHLGDVIEKADGTIYGDGVNIAARLEGLAEPGGITVSESIRTAVKGKVGASFEDQGEQKVKNIAEPVRAYRVRAEDTAAVASSPTTKPSPVVGEIDLSLPDKPSIAVLPFANLSGDPEQEYFTDGITEDIITELSRFESLFVIARNSSFSYKGKSPDIRQVGKELGVRYVVEGSIRRVANRIRVTAQLIDSLTRNHIWAERYDRELQDIFAVQEEVTECIVAAIAPQIDAAESLRARRRPGNLSAYEIAVRALALSIDGYTKSDRAARDEGLRQARAALAIDPESLPALNAVAGAQWQALLYKTAGDRETTWREGMDAVTRGIEIAQSPASRAIKALLLAYAPSGGRWDEALIEARTAHRLNPQDSLVIGIYANILANTGDPLESIRLLERSLRINPRDPNAHNIYSQLALAYIIARDYRKSLEWAMQARSAAPGFVQAHLHIAVLHVALGDIDKAKAALEAARRLAPELVQLRLGGKAVIRGREFQHRYDTFLRIAAGLEDPSAAEALR